MSRFSVAAPNNIEGVWVRKKYFRQCSKGKKNWRLENWNCWWKVKDYGENWSVSEKEDIEERAKRGDVGEGREKERWLRVPKQNEASVDICRNSDCISLFFLAALPALRTYSYIKLSLTTAHLRMSSTQFHDVKAFYYGYLRIVLTSHWTR
jgi:hypothetical protein